MVQPRGHVYARLVLASQKPISGLFYEKLPRNHLSLLDPEPQKMQKKVHLFYPNLPYYRTQKIKNQSSKNETSIFWRKFFVLPFSTQNLNSYKLESLARAKLTDNLSPNWIIQGVFQVSCIELGPFEGILFPWRYVCYL